MSHQLPGFTAEAALHCRHHSGRIGEPRSRSHPGAVLGSGDPTAVEPALPMRFFCVPSGETGYTMCCWAWDGGHYCLWTNS